MSPLRLALLSPRFWPLVGETEQFAADLAEGLRREGTLPTIVTARWSSDWPAETVHRELRVLRLSPAPVSNWSTYRYLCALSKWLRSQRQEIDVVYVLNLRQEAGAALRAVKDLPVGVVLRARGDDCRWLESSSRGARIRRCLFAADAIVAPTKAVCREVVAAGLAGVQMISNGVPWAEPATPAICHAARMAVGEANHDLAVPDFAPIAVTVGPLAEGRGLDELVDIWAGIAQRLPCAHLWIIGDGPLRARLYQRISDRDLRLQVSMPGTFDELSDVFYAADVYLAPARPIDGAQHLLQAMSVGLPVIAADAADCEQFVEHGRSGLILPLADRLAWTEGICALFEMPQRTALWREQVRRNVQLQFSATATIQEHQQLFQAIAASKQRGPG